MGHVRAGSYTDGSTELVVVEEGGLTLIRCDKAEWRFNENGFRVELPPPAAAAAKKPKAVSKPVSKNGDDPELD